MGLHEVATSGISMQMGASAVVLGASGYAGGELLRILEAHPAITVAAVAAGRSAGEKVASKHPHLFDDASVLVSLEEGVAHPSDVVFSALPAGELGPLIEGLRAAVIVDLSDEHRGAPGWLYGLTEYARHEHPCARVANPGCYPTATLLALLPFARAGAIDEPIVVDAMSGTSGAGRKSEDRLLHANLAGDVAAYGSVAHRHVPEMERALGSIGGMRATLSFTPHLVPLGRGLVVTGRARLSGALDDEGALGILHDAYAQEPFVHVVDDWPGCAAVAGTNHALVSARVDHRSGWLVVSAAIDNLGKGAAGQAIQNANLALGLEETLGLDRVAAWP